MFVLPIIAAPANQSQTLLTVLMQAQHICAEVVGPDRKTIITLDMDMRAIKIESLYTEHKGKWILRIGEFHTLLCTLRAIGSAIENSGIADSWIEAELYSSTTTRQILEGKHMKRAFDAHTTTLQVLADILLEEFTKTQKQGIRQVQASRARKYNTLTKMSLGPWKKVLHQTARRILSGPGTTNADV